MSGRVYCDTSIKIQGPMVGENNRRYYVIPGYATRTQSGVDGWTVIYWLAAVKGGFCIT